MNTAIDVFTKIQKNAETCKPTTRSVKSLKFGQGGRQGDIYILSLGKKDVDLPEALAKLKESAGKHETTLKNLTCKVGKATPNTQLAVGSTQGSRHIISPAPAGLKIFSPSDKESPLVGPVVVSPSRFTLTHPEHGHFSLPAGAYLCLYQREYAKERAEELRRVQD